METNLTINATRLIDEMAWGRHACYFYETQQDLLNTLVPYFKAGLEDKEFCLWVISKSELLTVAEAESALRKAVPDLDRYLTEGSLQIVNYDDSFNQAGVSITQRVINQFIETLNLASAGGYVGLRVSGSPIWAIKKDQREFHEFENELDKQIAGQCMMVLCTFPLVTTGAADILDAARTHQLVAVLRRGHLEFVESPDRIKAREEVKAFKRSCAGDLHLERLTPRQREVLALNAQGFSMKKIALVLNISVKTVETHRQNLMDRLDLHDVPSLVRYAIKSGLIALED